MDAKTLHQLFLKYPTISTDSRAITKDSLFFALSGEHFNGNQFAKEALLKGASYAIIDDKTYIDPVNKEHYILTDNSLKALQHLATTHRNYTKTPIIALTGSNGKTTTKELIKAVLETSFNIIATKGNLNNHIGVPLTLLQLKKDTELAIVEMGANHLGEIKLLSEITKPNYGYITNFGLAHLEGFGSKEGVIKGKSELYNYLKDQDQVIFYNINDQKQIELTKDYTKKIKCPDESLELIEANQQEDTNTGHLSVRYKKTQINTKLIGDYNIHNIAAAIGIGEYFEIPLKKIKNAIESYTPTNNRSQLIETNTNSIILDAYNANPSSMKVALKNFEHLKTKNNQKRNKVIIIGDMLELGSYAKEAHQQIKSLAESITTDIFMVGIHFGKTENNNIFSTTKELKDYLKNNPIENSLIFIKGSRGMALEQLLEVL